MPINVDVWRAKIFKFTEEATAPVMTETVRLHNTSLSPAAYQWETTKTVFIVSPLEVRSLCSCH